jgi:hypothetical protein
MYKLPEHLFDSWITETYQNEMMEFERVFSARSGLKKMISNCKSMKAMSAKAKPEKEVTDGPETDVSIS